MTQFAQQADANFTPNQVVGNALPTITVPGAQMPGAGWFPIPAQRTFGFVFLNAVAAGSTTTILPAIAAGFYYIKLLMMRFSAATEIRLQLGGVIFFDYDVAAGQFIILDFGIPGFTNSTVNTPLQVLNPFAITDIRVNAWGSASNA